MEIKTGLTRLAISAMAIASVSCSHVDEKEMPKREVASVGLIGPDGKVLIYYKDRDSIIVKSCEPHTVLGSTPAQAKENCQGRSNRIPIPYFRTALKSAISNIDLNGVKPFTSEEAKLYHKYEPTDENIELMKKYLLLAPKEIDKINTLIQTYGSEDDKIRKSEVLANQKDYQEYFKILKKIDAEIEKVVDFIINESTLSLQKSSTDKEKFLYNALKKFDPDTKIPCGLSGTIQERINNCATLTGSKKGNFVLVSRSTDLKETHLNTRTKMLWSDVFEGRYSLRGANEKCSSYPQTQSVLKGYWRLPSVEDFLKAEKDGSIEALPNINQYQWTSTTTGNIIGNWRSGEIVGKWDQGYIYMPERELLIYQQNLGFAIRCITKSGL